MASALLALVVVLALASGAEGRQKRIPWLTFNEVSLNGETRVLSSHEIFSYGGTSLSPDHRQFAYVPYTCDGCPYSTSLMVADVRSPHERLLVEAPVGILEAAWSPNGRWIAFVTDGVWVINADGTDLHRVSLGGFDLAWSPDSRVLAFDRLDENLDWHIGVLSVDTGQELVLADGFRPRWSPNGKLLLFENVAGRNEPLTIRTIPATGGVSRKVVVGGFPSWSPNGKRIAFIRSGPGSTPSSLWVIGNRVGAAPRRVATGAVGDILDPVWSPKSRSIAFRQGAHYCASKLSVVSADRKTRPRKLVAHTRIVTPLVWSNNGQKLIYKGERCSDQ